MSSFSCVMSNHKLANLATKQRSYSPKTRAHQQNTQSIPTLEPDSPEIVSGVSYNSSLFWIFWCYRATPERPEPCPCGIVETKLSKPIRPRQQLISMLLVYCSYYYVHCVILQRTSTHSWSLRYYSGSRYHQGVGKQAQSIRLVTRVKKNLQAAANSTVAQ